MTLGLVQCAAVRQRPAVGFVAQGARELAAAAGCSDQEVSEHTDKYCRAGFGVMRSDNDPAGKPCGGSPAVGSSRIC